MLVQPYQVLIADDELPSRQYIGALVSQDSRFRVLASCDNGLEAVAHARAAQVDVAFLDIRMPGMSGFQVLEAIESSVSLIVFVTAYSDYAVRAYDVDAFDYVTKPLDPTRFSETLDRLSTRLQERRAVSQQQATGSAASSGSPMPIHPAGSKKLLNTVGHDLVCTDDEIEAIESQGNYVNVRIRGEYYLVRESLESFSGQLSAATFVRVHRSFVVNIHRVLAMRHGKSGTAEVVLADGHIVPVSRRHRNRVAEALRKILSSDNK